ncbi:3'-5' exonuclease [Rufibacter roseus]|uniref:PolC-type DNA polymerase III n=1 Tax=Rufibacter roseus TaxID=1567108 RepID=A0ABW2DJR2_9BACT|nr:3'-5' exonuclease [Rufibacter roseus]
MSSGFLPLFPSLVQVLDNYTVLDFETTGVSGSKGQVIEIGALKGAGAKVTARFHALIKLQGELPPKITEITGITATDLENGIDERSAFTILQEFIGDSVVVAHNAPFDLGFLYNTYRRLKLKPTQHPFLDTLSVCRLRQPSPRSLQAMCQTYGIKHSHWHRALPDATATLYLLHKLHEEASIDPFLNKIVVNPKYGSPKLLPPFAEIISPPDSPYTRSSLSSS